MERIDVIMNRVLDGLYQSGRVMTYIGVDPGENGALAFLEPWAGNVGWFPFKGGMDGEMLDMLSLTHVGSYRILVESVHAMPKQGVTSMFSFGKQFGMILGVLEAYRLGYEMTTPQKWQKYMGITKIPGETKTAKKNRHKAMAQELFPEIKVTHAVADALLIAECCRRMREEADDE
jgi:crossover junction endodeoxyribonuclease RuvC